VSYFYLRKVKTFYAAVIVAAALVFFVAGSVNGLAKYETVPVPDKDMAVSLIYEAIIAVNNASQTGNFSVLRDLGAPEFQLKYTVEDLAQTFRALREKKIDLRPTVLLKPVIRQSQYIKSKSLFRMKGFMPTRPVRLHFEIHYQYVDKNWRLYALTFDFESMGRKI